MKEPNEPRDHDWDEVSTLFGGYLHQDFAEDYGDVWGAVRQYCTEASSDSVSTAADQVKEILDRSDDEEGLDAITSRLGSSYHPPGAGQTYRHWLIELERVLRAASTAPFPNQ